MSRRDETDGFEKILWAITMFGVVFVSALLWLLFGP